MAIALVLGGGAPNLTLMAGALAALDERLRRQPAGVAGGAEEDDAGGHAPEPIHRLLYPVRLHG